MLTVNERKKVKVLVIHSCPRLCAGERQPGETGETLLSHFQMLGVTLACLAHRADNKLLFSQRRCLVLTVDLTALALIGLRNEQDFPALFCFNCCSS